MDEELRRLVFVAQQRRWRYVSIPIPSTALETEEELRENEAALCRADDARLALALATSALLDYLQAQIDAEKRATT